MPWIYKPVSKRKLHKIRSAAGKAGNAARLAGLTPEERKAMTRPAIDARLENMARRKAEGENTGQ